MSLASGSGGEGASGMSLALSPAQSLPPPRPKSPPEYPDIYGKRREAARVQVLEREISFLEGETKFIEGVQPASRCCKEVSDFVIANSDPMIPTQPKSRRPCRFWKWLCSCVPCMSLVSFCCCCHSECSCRLRKPKCCSCTTCNCIRSKCCDGSCCSKSCCCCCCPRLSCPSCSCFRGCCSCSCPDISCCIPRCFRSCTRPSCVTTKKSSCFSCKCKIRWSSCFRCPKVRLSCCCFCNCKNLCYNPCCLAF